jgi:hypothetical protein
MSKIELDVDEFKGLIKDAVSEDRKNQEALNDAANRLHDSQQGGGVISLQDELNTTPYSNRVYDSTKKAVTSLYYDAYKQVDLSDTEAVKKRRDANTILDQFWSKMGGVNLKEAGQYLDGKQGCPKCGQLMDLQNESNCSYCNFSFVDYKRLGVWTD